MKNILITGPIADFGGREVEVNSIIKSLSKNYKIKLFSTTHMTNNSMVLIGDDNFEWSTLSYQVCKKYFLINIFAFFSGLKNKTKNYYKFSSNRLNIFFKKQINESSFISKIISKINVINKW